LGDSGLSLHLPRGLQPLGSRGTDFAHGPPSRTLVVPITTRAASAHLEPPYLVHASARDLQLSWDGWIHADQVFTFPTAELDERIGLLPGRKMAELDQALRFELDV